MNTRRIVVLLLGISVAAIAMATACGGGSSQKVTGAADCLPHTPDRPWTPYMGWKSESISCADNVQEAVGFARELFFACPGSCGRDFEWVRYVVTTVGQAKELFDPQRQLKIWEAPDAARAVVVVAHGQFTSFCMGCGGVVHDYVGWKYAVVPIGQRGTFGDGGGNDEPPDIAQLGEVHDVPLPLPKWPTPVALETPTLQSSARQAVAFAMKVYAACPPYCAQYGLSSVQYVETTVGQLRQMFGTALAKVGSPDDWSAWAVVAHGEFSSWRMGCIQQHVTHIGSSFWVFGLKNKGTMAQFATYDAHDINELGTAYVVSLPLPPWPTPVALDLATAPVLVASTLQDAIRLTASFYTGHGSTLSYARPDTVQYVRTTAGQAESFFQRADYWSDVPSETPAWVFVAYGQFQIHNMGVADTFQPPATASWVIVPSCCPQGGSPHDALWGYSTRRYDLTQLGTVMDLPPSAYASY